MEQFDWIEYSVFSLMLALSTLIGFYFGCIKGGQDTVEGYLLGGKHMSVFPIAMSLVSSYISGITILGIPTEIYTYGTQYLLSNVANLCATALAIIIFLPVFYKLQLLSLFEYMEMRFDHKVRKIASLLYTIALFTYVPIVIYGPALALNQVSDMNIHVVTPIICTVCIFYTTIGGLQAVVWSDALQGAVMVGATITVVVLGTIKVGGVGAVIQSAIEGDRIEFFNMNPDPTARLTFWTSTIGFTIWALSNFATSPANIQRYISLPTFRQAKLSLILMCFGIMMFFSLSGIIGLIMYAEYKGCDPLKSKMISRPDQILPHFVLLVAKKVRGLPGLFMAGVVCAALSLKSIDPIKYLFVNCVFVSLSIMPICSVFGCSHRLGKKQKTGVSLHSTLSTCLNTLAGTFYEDFIEPSLDKKISQKHASLIMKILVVVFGIICVFLVTIVEKLGALIEISAGFSGVTSGTTIGLFFLGTLFPWANAKGALIGGIVSLLSMMWLLVCSTFAKINGHIVHPTKPLSVDNCTHNFNYTISNIIQEKEVFFLYKLSFFNYTIVGCSIVLIVGMITSYLTGFNKIEDTNTDLFSPVIRPFLPKNTKYNAVQMKDAINDT